MSEFFRWIGEPEEALLGSWSRFDHDQLRLDARRHSVDFPWPHRESHVDVQRSFSRWARRRGRSRRGRKLGRAIEELGLTFEGTPHRGIDDARQVGRIFEHIYSPDNVSPRARLVLDTARSLGRPFDVRDLTRLDPTARTWWKQVLTELQELYLIRRSGSGYAIAPTTTN